MAKTIDRKLAAQRFAEEWRDGGQEDKHDQTFWNQFLQEVMGIDRVYHIIDYQKRVKIAGTQKRIDGYIAASKVLIEQKSAGTDLTRKATQSDGAQLDAYEQAFRYASYLPANEQPNYIITSNFHEFRIYDRNNDPAGEEPVVISLDELPQQLAAFDFIVRPVHERIARQQQVNLEAAKLMGQLYDKIKHQYHDSETTRYDLAVLMVRIMFCLYAEDSGLFETNLFREFLDDIPTGKGAFRGALIQLFNVLDTPEGQRDPYIGETLAQFPYVNGGLFANEIEIPIFTDDIKNLMLIKMSRGFNWTEISPVIFGSIFESILSGDERRAGGMHYTSVENIHKVIDPLFLDELRLEFQKAGNKKPALRKLQDKMASLTFLDPAAGSGNFLTQTYLELRALENEILSKLLEDTITMDFGEGDVPSFIKVNVGQFYGIEINDFAVSVASAALWIADHQANQQTAKIIDHSVINLPLKNYSNIVCGNALRMDWNNVLPASECSYIMGNPPFLGARNQTTEQKAEIQEAFADAKNSGNIDYVAGWYAKATDYIQGTDIKCAFVSTNSICQGEQVANIWKPLFEEGVHINFAHKTFRWSSEATGGAHVFCVIVGFSLSPDATALFEYETPVSAFTERSVKHINAYLINAPNTLVYSRSKPLSDVPEMGIGNKPIDGGSYLFTPNEKEDFLLREPMAARFFRPFVGASEFIRGNLRWCLWLGDITASELAERPECRRCIEAVREFRLSSRSEGTRKIASTPTRFHVENMPENNFILVPRHSSDRRRYIPIGFVSPESIAGDSTLLISPATLYHFGVLTSQFHNAWMRIVAGRLKGDYRYSAGVVYNNFVWPDPTDVQKVKIEECAQAILDARENYPNSSLADMYDPDNDFLFLDLVKAHEALDKTVEQAYGVDFNGDEQKIVAHLFELYDRSNPDA